MLLFDAHFHIIDPQYPLIENQGFLPTSFSCDDYQKRTSNLQSVGGVVVSGSYQGFDQSYLLDALQKLGPKYVGVTQINPIINDHEVLALKQAGIRGIRVNVLRGDFNDWSLIQSLAHRVYKLAGWHIEIYADVAQLAPQMQILCSLPAVCIDHMGLTEDGHHLLFKLVEHDVKVKASGFGRVDFSIAPVLKNIYKINSKALMFGSDLPSTRAPRPFSEQDIQLIIDHFDPEQAANILYRNALDFYRINLKKS